MTMNDVNGTTAPEPAAGAPAGASPATPPPTLSAEELADLTQRAAKAGEAWDRYLRAVADLDNFRKRAARERTEAVQHANEALLRRLLPVLDNFEMALAAAGPNATVESLTAGVAMIHSQLRQTLVESGVEEVNAAGQAFDPNLHEAVSQLESADTPEGHVLHQVRKGYRLHGRLLRPASVVVARPPAS
jgi:molecular chaperone GrpE